MMRPNFVPERLRPSVLAVGASAVLCVLYLIRPPATPDLAAQMARAGVVDRVGVTTWWTGWFGGLSLPSYSTLSPALMSWFGVAVSGALCIVISSVAASHLLVGSVRPRLGTVMSCLAVTANVVDGRTTFAIGVTFALCALLAIRRNMTFTAGLSALSFFGSPLAGLFLGIILIAIAKEIPRYRRRALGCAALLAVLALAMQVFFPGTGTMPFSIWAALSAAVGGLTTVVTVREPVIRTTALLALAGLALFAVFPGAVGDNLTRLFWIAALPCVAGYAVMPAVTPAVMPAIAAEPSHALRRRVVVAAAVLAAVWPAWDVGSQVAKTFDRSVTAEYYAPLASQLHLAQTNAGADSIGQRIEVLDVAGHWDAAYFTDFSLARGWDRQADHAENPLFYRGTPLTAADYRLWLDALAVGWVAVPNADLDYASQAEQHLIDSGLPYLQSIWQSSDWRLYRVVAPTPLIDRATVTVVTADAVHFQTTTAGHAATRIRYSPYLVVSDQDSGRRLCVEDDAGWAGLSLPSAGRYQLDVTFNPAARFRSPTAQCAS